MCLLNRNVGIISAFTSILFLCSLFSLRICYTIVGRTSLDCVEAVAPGSCASCAPSHTQLPAPPTLVCNCIAVCVCVCVLLVCALEAGSCCIGKGCN